MNRIKWFVCWGIFGLLLTAWACDQGREARVIHISGAGVGYGGFVNVSLWLADNLMKQNDDLTIWFDYYYTGKAFRDGVLLLADGKADICLVNSQGVSNMALRGRGLFEQPVPLRAVAALPQHDWCLFAVDAKLGVQSFADLRERKVPLKIATGFLDEPIAFLAFEVLKRHGIDLEEFKSWGGEFIEGTPPSSREEISSGRANAVFQEGAYNKAWEEVVRQRPLTYLSIEPEVAKEIEEELGWTSLTVPANYYPGQDKPFLALDFSDWLICVREDMDENMAYQLARIVVEKGEELEHASLNLLDPVKLAKTSIPLHPGAARYYKEKGLQ